MAEPETQRRDALPEAKGQSETRALPENKAGSPPLDGVVLTEEQRRSRRSRSVAIALVLGALCLLFYVVTIVKLGPAVLIRPL